MKAVIFFLSLAVAGSTAFAAPVPKYAKADKPYEPMRARLQKSGWKPHGLKLRQEGQCLDSRCEEYTEAKDCSGTGLGYCRMVWRHKDGTILVIVTAGEEDFITVSAEIER
jgi:hypothetical protein